MRMSKLARRTFLLSGLSSAAAVNAALVDATLNWRRKISGSGNPYLSAGPAVQQVTVLNDFTIPALTPGRVDALMQTNGVAIKLDTNGAGGTLDLAKVRLIVTDRGHDISGNVVDRSRTIGVRDQLRGPFGANLYYSPSPQEMYLVLDDRVFNQDADWRTQIAQLVFEDGWLTDQPGQTIDGASVQRLDSLAYLPFPVKTPTVPFQRTGIGSLSFEVSGMNDFARDGGPFACVEAWANVAGYDGPLSRSGEMTTSIETPLDLLQTGLPAPVYSLTINTFGLPDGSGEIQYVVKPWIGPPWSSLEKGEDFPTANAPKGLPFVNDPSGSFAPLYGIVSQDGYGSDGNALSGLSFSIEGALNSRIVYRDAAAIAAAVRTINRSTSVQVIADGYVRRALPHDDIAGGVAVLLPVAGSQLGANSGSYAIRTPFSASSAYPTGATPFEIRSLSGRAADDVRLRGVLADNTVIATTKKAIPARLILRGVTLDGSGTTGAANIVIDGTAAAGAATVKPAAEAAAYLISIDSRFIENETAGSANAIRYRAGYLWDVRVEHRGISGLGSLCATGTNHSALVASIGSLYARSTRGSALSPTCILGVNTVNVPLVGQGTGVQPTFTGQLVYNLRVELNTAFTSPAILLATARPVVGGLGLCNVLALGTVDSGGPLIQIGADGTRVAIDNAIIRHLGHYLVNGVKLSNGRANLFYQDQGFTRVDKIGSIGYCAFTCYTVKGDTFPAPEKLGATGTSSELTWVSGKAYFKGAIVWDTLGAASLTSTFYQAISDIRDGESVALSNSSKWYRCPGVYGQPYGAQALRQGNAAIRYHIGCRGNVACLTYNTASMSSSSSGYGYRWGDDEAVNCNPLNFYIDPFAGDFRPKDASAGGVLVDRVVAGAACVPFDLAGNRRANDGTGAAGPYERVMGQS